MPILFLILLIAIFVLPSLWVKRVMQRYSEPEGRYPESGAQLARRLLAEQGCTGVQVETTGSGDHYDPEAKAVRLSEANFAGQSLTAITIAAHEVGHALQDHTGYQPLRWRSRLVRASQVGQRVAAGFALASPFLGAAVQNPRVGLLTLLSAVAYMGLAVIVHLVTLPTELDASYRRALPMLKSAGILQAGDLRHARKLLTAAAFTYVAGALMSMVNLARWWAILRR